MTKDSQTDQEKKLDIAIIGGGIGGLTSGYLLNKKHNVTLFEKSHRIGGNAYTYTTGDGDDIDIAVAAFSKSGYQHFYSLLAELGINTSLCPNSYMSFHNLDTNDGVYLAPNLATTLREKIKVLRPTNALSILRLLRGVAVGKRLLQAGALNGLTLAEALDKIPAFRGDTRIIFICTLCLLSSMYTEEVLATPARFFFEKLSIHDDIISAKAVVSVRCVEQHTRSYVEALSAPFQDHIHINTDVRQVTRNKTGVTVFYGKNEKRRFDKVVFACNADQALAILKSPTKDEKKLLGAWKYRVGRVVVHDDFEAFPSENLIQAYTFLYTDRDGKLDTSVNGALWHEPGVSKDCRLLSSQHPNFDIREDHIEMETYLRTPIFDAVSYATIPLLPKLNGVKHSYYCGSHFGFGLHNDAVQSAMAVAHALGVDFEVPPDPTLADRVKRRLATPIQSVRGKGKELLTRIGSRVVRSLKR